jgi:hypothetical protein
VTQEPRPSPFGSLPLAFTKMSGAGNDFLVFGARVVFEGTLEEEP